MATAAKTAPAPPSLGIEQSCGLSNPGAAISGNEALNQIAAAEIAKAKGQVESKKHHQLLTISKWAQESMGCPIFLERWNIFKKKADKVFGEGKGPQGDFPHTSEFDMQSIEMNADWKALIDKGIALRAKKEGVSAEEMPQRYADEQIKEIERLGYVLDKDMKNTLVQALTRFFICDIGPATFSILAVLGDDKQKANKMITVSHHCLQMATHFLRHPPSFMNVRELDELVTLALFHDVYYYDDYLHHDARVLDIFGKYLKTDYAKQVIGDHLNITPDREAVRKGQFKSNLDMLKQEWVQMDWYLTMVNLQKESPKPGLNTVLPLEFFHHMLGRVLTNNFVLPMSSKVLDETMSAPPAWVYEDNDKSGDAAAAAAAPAED